MAQCHARTQLDANADFYLRTSGVRRCNLTLKRMRLGDTGDWGLWVRRGGNVDDGSWNTEGGEGCLRRYCAGGWGMRDEG